MTDTTAPLAVTMDLIERLDALAFDYDALREQLKLRASKTLDQQLLCDPDLLTLETRSSDLRALTALARRCLEPDGETVEAVTAKMHDGVRRPSWSSFKESEWKDTWRYAARAAIAALVNPDGK